MTNQKKKRGPPPKGSRSTPQRTSPAFVTPMAAQVVKRLPEGDDWIYELKFDGYRALIIKDEQRVEISAEFVEKQHACRPSGHCRPVSRAQPRMGGYTPAPWGPTIDRHADRAWSRGYLDELRRRKVVQWGLAYAAGAWVLLQVLGFARGCICVAEPSPSSSRCWGSRSVSRWPLCSHGSMATAASSESPPPSSRS